MTKEITIHFICGPADQQSFTAEYSDWSKVGYIGVINGKGEIQAWYKYDSSEEGFLHFISVDSPVPTISPTKMQKIVSFAVRPL